MNDEEFWLLLTGRTAAPLEGDRNHRVSPRWIAWAKQTILNVSYIPPEGTEPGQTVPGRPDALARYLCRLIRILDSVAGEDGPVRKDEVELENLLLGAADIAGLRITLSFVPGYGDHVISHACDIRMLHSEEVDQWHKGMRSGGGWKTLYSVTVLGNAKPTRAAVHRLIFGPSKMTLTPPRPH